jgi:surface protein
LKLKCDEPLSKCAFKFNLRHFSTAQKLDEAEQEIVRLKTIAVGGEGDVCSSCLPCGAGLTCGVECGTVESPDNAPHCIATVPLGALNPGAFRAAITACLGESPESAVSGCCPNNDYGPIPFWDTTNIPDMSEAFFFKSTFNGDISSWATQNVVTMRSMFHGATNFNQALNGWDTGSVTDMRLLFFVAANFNQALNDWDTGKVVYMFAMFADAANFNQALNDWDTGKVEDMGYMFEGAAEFDQDITGWASDSVVGRCRLIVSKPELKACLVSALETKM